MSYISLFQVKNLFDKLKATTGTIDFEQADGALPLPPASSQSFLKKNINIPALVIANHKEKYTNK